MVFDFYTRQNFLLENVFFCINFSFGCIIFCLFLLKIKKNFDFFSVFVCLVCFRLKQFHLKSIQVDGSTYCFKCQ